MESDGLLTIMSTYGGSRRILIIHPYLTSKERRRILGPFVRQLGLSLLGILMEILDDRSCYGVNLSRKSLVIPSKLIQVTGLTFGQCVNLFTNVTTFGVKGIDTSLTKIEYQ